MSKRRKNKSSKNEKNSKKKNHNKSKTKIEALQEKQKNSSFGKKAGLGFLVASLFAVGGFLLCDSNKPEKIKLRQYSQRQYYPRNYPQAELGDLRKIYDDWMQHYIPEGINLEDLKNKSKTIKSFLDNIDSQAKAKELINKPYDEFLHSDRKYSDYSLEAMSSFFFNSITQINIRELHNKYFNPAKIKEIKGLKEIEDYALKNYYELIQKNDDDFAFWALNAAYYVARRNLKAGFVNSNSKEELEKAFEKGVGDCEVISHFTRKLYLILIGNFKKKHLSTKIIANAGFLLEKGKKHTIGHQWLYFIDKGKKNLVETNAHNDDCLFNDSVRYNPNKTYIKGCFDNTLYIPLFSNTFEPSKGKSYTLIKKLHFLPKQIEQEIAGK